MAWSSGLWRHRQDDWGQPIGICGCFSGQSSSHLSLKGPVSEKPQCGHDYQLGTELLLYSFRSGFPRLPGPWAGSLRKIPSSPVSCVCKTFGLDLGESDAGAKEGTAWGTGFPLQPISETRTPGHLFVTL